MDFGPVERPRCGVYFPLLSVRFGGDAAATAEMATCFGEPRRSYQRMGRSMATDLERPWAVVSGVEFRNWAADRANCGWRPKLVLTARRSDRLEAFASKLKRSGGDRCGGSVSTDGPHAIFEFTEAQGDQTWSFVNNAGFGIFGVFGHGPGPAWRDSGELCAVGR